MGKSMNDPVSDPVSTSKVVGFLVAGFIGLLSFIGRRLMTRVDKLESIAVDKDEYNKTIESIRTEMKQGHEKTQSLIIDLYKNQKG